MSEPASTNMVESDPNEETTSTALNKACEPCRRSKLRCILDPDSANGSCKRCVATSRRCIFNAPVARRRRAARTDTRVAELERQLRALQMKLDQQQRGTSPTVVNGPVPSATTWPGDFKFQAPLTPGSWPAKKVLRPSLGLDISSRSLGIPQPTSHDDTSPVSDGTDAEHEYSIADDVVSRGILSYQDAVLLFNRFRVYYEVQYPFVIIPPHMTTMDVRLKRPISFLAILVATSPCIIPEKHPQLNRELMSLIANRMMLEGDRTLDLVQAMIITAVWYSPSEKLERLKHYQFAHLAATTAMDIGVADEKPSVDKETKDQDLDHEQRTTLLACYLLCTGISLATGRPSMLRYTPYMQKCLEKLVVQPNASLADRRLVAWVTLQRLAEHAVETFFSEKSSIDLDDALFQSKVESSCRRLEQWKDSLSFPMDGSLAIHYYQIRSRILCACLYPNHPYEDFRPPFRIRHINALMPAASPTLTPFFARTFMGLVRTVHGAFDAFSSMTKDDMIAAPVISYVRVCHALAVLLMLGMSTLRQHNEICKICDQHTLKVDLYLNMAVAAVSRTVGSTRLKTQSKFLKILDMMEKWWQSQSQQDLVTMEYDLIPFRSPASSSDVPHASLESTVVLPESVTIPDIVTTDTGSIPSDPFNFTEEMLDMDYRSSSSGLSPFSAWMDGTWEDGSDVSGLMDMSTIDWSIFDSSSGIDQAWTHSELA